MSAARSRLGVIFLTVFIDLVGFGLILPILPYYAQRFGVEGLGFGALIGAFSLMQFVSTVVLGRLSDRIGRRPVLLGSILLGVAGYTVFAFAGSYWVLFGARMVSGFAGGNMSVAQAYIADITTPADRSRGMGLVGAAFGLGFIVGPGLGGLAGHYGGPAAVGLLAAGLCLANFSLGFFILRESLHADLRVRRRLLDVEHLVRGLRERRFRAGFITFGIIPFAFSGYVVSFPLFAERQFGWAERDLGIYFTVVGVVAASVQGYFFGHLARRTGDRMLAIAGTFGMAIAIAAVPFLHTVVAVYAWVVVLAFSNSITQPALSGIVSTLAGPKEQGAMLGAAQSLSSLGRFSGPVLMGQIFDAVGPRAAFLTAGLFTGIGCLVALSLPRRPSHTAQVTAGLPDP